MERKLTKEELGMKVLLPRAQYAGVNVTDAELPKLQDYNLEAAQSVPGMGTVQLIVQQQAPRMVFQLIEAESEQQFDSYLGTLVGMHQVPSYITGRLDFMVLFAGARDEVEVNQQNHEQVYQQICQAQDDAARWWHLYGHR
jgi:hypothetical protein